MKLLTRLQATFLGALFILQTTFSFACSPCGALSNITQTVNGNNLELTFTSNAGWECCYNVNIEIVCLNETFTGIANYQSSQICINGGSAPSTTNNTPVPYPLTVIDLTSFCPGMYKWRATETGCGIYTAEYTFEVLGTNPTPIIVDITATEDSICVNDNTQLTASATGGCGIGGYEYLWSPAQGLSSTTVANPVASPSATTTYTCSVTETGTCGTSSTADYTITVNPLPTASVTGDIVVCQGDTPPIVTFTGASATAPYTIEYAMNGAVQTPLVTSGNTATISVPTNTPGAFYYQIIGVTESSSTQCYQTQSGGVTVIVNPLPVVDAGQDQEICEPNPTSPSEITLYGSGATSYVWDNGVTDGVAFVPPLGQTVYTVIGTDANGCSNTDYMTVYSYPQPTADGSASILLGNVPVTVDFSNFSIEADTYTWDFGDNSPIVTTNSLIGVSHTYTEPGLYTVILTASNGICYDVWTIEIDVLPPMVVTPPNIFTPNGDGANDEYFVNVQYGEQFEALIVNRWGNEITTLTHLNQGWNGKSNGVDVVEGTYYIKFKATDYSGNVQEGHSYFRIVR